MRLSWRCVLPAALSLLGAAGCADVQIARNPNADVNSVRKIAVEPFSTDPAQSRISGEWQTALLAQGYRVIERGSIDLILKEHGLNLSGLVDPDQAAKIGAILGVQGILMGRAGSAPYMSYGTMGNELLSEPPPLSVKLVDAATARVLWNMASPDKGEYGTHVLRQGDAVDDGTQRSLRNMLSGGNWSYFPKDGYNIKESGLRIAFDPEIKQTRKIRIGVYPLKSKDEEVGKEWADRVTNVLLDSGYDVIDRSQLETLMKEQKFDMTGMVNPDEMVKIGKMAGIQALAFGATAGEPTCAYTVRVADLETGELYWSAYGNDCRLTSLSTAVAKFFSDKSN